MSNAELIAEARAKDVYIPSVKTMIGALADALEEAEAVIRKASLIIEDTESNYEYEGLSFNAVDELAALFDSVISNA